MAQAKQPHDCEGVQVDAYEMEEVVLPAVRERRNVKGIRVVVHGRNLRAVAQPLVVRVGKAFLRFLRIAPDERSVEGILLDEPEPGAVVEVRLGDTDVARHPDPVSPQSIRRLAAPVD